MDGDQQNVIRQHSGWLIPLGFAVAVLLLCGLFLAWYLRPGPRSGAPTGDAAPVTLSVGGLRLAVPANYLATAAARAGGTQDMLALWALMPNMHGYSEQEARRFADNAPDSPVIHLLLRHDPSSLDTLARLTRIYLPSAASAKGSQAPFGLVQFTFRPDTAYSRDDLFVGKTSSGLMLLLCGREEPDLPGPSCQIIADPPAPNVSLSYRFKRSSLSRWRQIAGGVDDLMRRFEKF